MPLHEYTCIKCRRVVEVLSGKEKPPRRCLECGGRMAPVPISLTADRNRDWARAAHGGGDDS